MNTKYRMGEGDQYVEICVDFERIDMTKFVWWFQEIIAGDIYSNKELITAMKEVIDSIDIKENIQVSK